MGLSRSTFHETAPTSLDADVVLTGIGAICDEFECYGYRRVRAAPRHQGVVVNSKKLWRLMRERNLQPKRRRRNVVTTDSDHAGSSTWPPSWMPGRATSTSMRSAGRWTRGSPSRR